MSTLETPPLSDWVKEAWPHASKTTKTEVVCRHCHRLNRIDIRLALTKLSGYSCAQCNGDLFLKPSEALEGLPHEVFEHPLDSSALSALKAIPGLDTLTRYIFKQISVRSFMINLRANALELGEDQFPELVEIVQQMLDRFGLKEEPHVFLASSPMPNLMTTGSRDAILIFTSALLDYCDDEQIAFAVGHELGHLMCEHGIYRFIAMVLMHGGLRMLPDIAKAASLPLQAALLRWMRCAELTADRAGVIACGNPEVALRTMMGFAGGNSSAVRKRTTLKLSSFIRQAKTLKQQEVENAFDSLLTSATTWRQTHPVSAWRVLELLKWLEEGNFFNIMAGEYTHLS